jgi:hypothetical protein
MWCRWDGIHYLNIARLGYDCPPDNLCAAFFPAYPLLVAGLQHLSGLADYLCGLVIANAADVVAWGLVLRWCQARLRPRQALWAWFAFVAFPTRNFGFSVYTEGLFLGLAVAAFMTYERRRMLTCAACCALISGVRPQGIFVGAALLADALWATWKAPPRLRKPLLWANLPLLLAPAGLLLYMAFLWQRFGRPLLFMEVQSVWHRHWVAPWSIIGVHADPLEYAVLLTATAVLAAMIGRRAPVRDCVYVGLSLLAPMSTGRLTSINRFVGVLFPLFVWGVAACPKGRWVRLYWLVALAYSCVFAFKLGQGAKVI